MKNVKLLFIALAGFFFTQCATTELEAFAPHFHSQAKKVSTDEVSATIKVPGRYGEDLVYLSNFEPVFKVSKTPETGVKFPNREEFVLAKLYFSTNENDLLDSKDSRGITWDADCGVLEFRSKVDPQSLSTTSIASIMIILPEGVQKIYERSEEHKSHDEDCYRNLSQSTSPSLLFATLLFHPGHPVKDPEFGQGGIELGG